jgi:hypothetical protein
VWHLVSVKSGELIVINYSLKCLRNVHTLILNRKAAKDTKVFLLPFPDRNERSEKIQCPAGRPRYHLPELQTICSGCLPCVLRRPSSMVHSSSEGIRV